jgi:uncharacterized protein YdcH (DUF465 family)
MSEDDLKDELIASDDEFRRLYREHQECEERLEALDTHSLSPENEIETKRVKLHKLALKDRMYSILRERTGAERVSA